MPCPSPVNGWAMRRPGRSLQSLATAQVEGEDHLVTAVFINFRIFTAAGRVDDRIKGPPDLGLAGLTFRTELNLGGDGLELILVK